MAKSNGKEKVLLEQFIDKRVGQIIRYRNLANALIGCHNYFSNKNNYDSFLGGKINGMSPDMIIKCKLKESVDIIGDGKKGLPTAPNKEPNETWEQYKEKKLVKLYLEKVLPDVKREIDKYSVKLDKITEPHDLFILCPSGKMTAINLLEKEGKFDNKIIILSFSFGNDENKRYTLRINKDRGKFSDEDINNDFEITNGIYEVMEDFAGLMSKHKLYLAEKEDYNAPIEWIMLIIWQYILPEIANSKDKAVILKKLTTGQIEVEITLNQIIDFVKKNYKLPTFNGDKELISSDIIKKAITELKNFTDVQQTDDERSLNPKYRIIWKKMPADSLMREFVKKVHKAEFEAKIKAELDKPSLPEKVPEQKELLEFKTP